MPGGAETYVGVGKQSNKTTAATNLYKLFHDEAAETPGQITDRGRPEVGGSLATGLSVDVYGARPAFTGNGKFRIGSEGLLLVGVGFGSVTNSGGTTTFSMVSAGSVWPYLTVGYDDNVSTLMGLVAARLNLLDIDFTSGQAPTYTYAGQARDHRVIAPAKNDQYADFVPTPAVTIPGAQRVLFGSGTAVAYNFGMRVDGVHDTENQVIGDILSDDVIPTQYVTSFRASVPLGSAELRQAYYGSSGGTAVGATLMEGAMSYRIYTAGTVGAGTVGFVEFAAPSAKYLVAGPLRRVPGSQIQLPLVIVPTSTAVTVKFVNGQNGSIY